MTGNLLTINACNQDDNEKRVIETENKQQGVGAKNEEISVISGEAEADQVELFDEIDPDSDSTEADMEQYSIVTDYEEMPEQEYAEYVDEYPDELSEDNDRICS